ncbi:MAG: bifunctional phosphoribosylaminoimidazolecarboxamide formyltransferase/IMP cyclohydrolase [Fimbriiglobus sp.]
MPKPIRRALMSVSDKTGLVEFATVLHEKHGVELIATGGTRKALADAGLPVKDVSELTGFPEILDGRVKSLHPNIYAGLLAKRDNHEHMATMAARNLPEIDLVVCNLYPFEKTVANPNVTEAEAIENIDIGGPCMVRAAAKNFESVWVIVDPKLYTVFLEALAADNKNLLRPLRGVFAGIAFRRIAEYDKAIADYFIRDSELGEGEKDELKMFDEESDEQDPSGWYKILDDFLTLKMPLRYGENPHQKAALYKDEVCEGPNIVNAEQLHGKELSYNNILDLDSAWNICREFEKPTAVVVKHNNPCGAASGVTLAEAFTKAWDGDPLSAFGGIIAFNSTVDEATANAMLMGERFVECIVAPGYSAEALDKLKNWKKAVRLLSTGAMSPVPGSLDYRRVTGGFLVQTNDVHGDKPSEWKVVTQRIPTEAERASLEFAWLVCKHVKSNAIVLAQGTQIVGVGAGQMSRVMAVEIAIRKAGEHSQGAVLASDAFFPFPDNVELAAAAGVKAVIQPGGSKNDPDVIAACDKHGIAMIFTGVRHFRH